MADLFAFAPRTTAPKRTKAPLPTVPVLRSQSGRICDFRCMFALGPDCDCHCGGRNHQRGLVCDGFSQEDMGL